MCRCIGLCEPAKMMHQAPGRMQACAVMKCVSKQERSSSSTTNLNTSKSRATMGCRQLHCTTKQHLGKIAAIEIRSDFSYSGSSTNKFACAISHLHKGKITSSRISLCCKLMSHTTYTSKQYDCTVLRNSIPHIQCIVYVI